MGRKTTKNNLAGMFLQLKKKFTMPRKKSKHYKIKLMQLRIKSRNYKMI